MSGAPPAAGGGGYGRDGGRGGSGAPPQRSFEERAQHKEQMMASIKESSQQERRVYVGNLSYDVKWHHLKDFMRQGASTLSTSFEESPADNLAAGEVIFADVLLLPNGMSKVGAYV
jgi:RNA recognition motif-containing protein